MTAHDFQDPSNRFIGVVLADIKNNCLKLPTPPEVAVRVRRAVEGNEASTAQIARLIGTDAALSARLIQVANSPLYRGRTPIDNVQTAVTRLGNKMVRDLVTALLMKQLFQSRSPLLRKRMEVLWLHSAEVSAFSSVLARRFTSLSAEGAMLAGLLHDIGALPLIVRAEDFPEIANDPDLLESAIERLHGQIGKLLLDTWKFPPELSAVAAEHEDLSRYSATVDYVDVVTVANLHSYMGGSHRLSKVNWGDIPAFGKLGITPKETVALMEEMRGEINDLRQMIAG
jgi:HD-like signal output (HDOD) protein